MELDRRLKELRLRRGLTQEQAAQVLGVSAQVVSKWERGLTQPDVQMMPRIAVLYRISLDELYDMDAYYSRKHIEEYLERINRIILTEEKDTVFQLIAEEISLRPTAYEEYLRLIWYAAYHRMNEKVYVDQLVPLVERVEQFCRSDKIRHTIFRQMVSICAHSEDPEIQKLTKNYYEKLPYLSNSREFLAPHVLKGEELENSESKTLMQLLEYVRERIQWKMLQNAHTPEEKIRYFHMTTGIFDLLLEDKFAGYFETPLLLDLLQTAREYFRLGEYRNGEEYLAKILKILRRHMSAEARNNPAEFASDYLPKDHIPYWQSAQNLLEEMLKIEEFQPYYKDIRELYNEYKKYFSNFSTGGTK